MRSALLRWSLVLGFVVGCAGSKAPAPAGAGGDSNVGGAAPIECHTVAPTACAEPSPHYEADIKPIVERICLHCHLGEKDGPWALTSYEHLADWHDLLRTAMLNCSMPPADSGLTMSLEERQLMLNWLRCGFPE